MNKTVLSVATFIIPGKPLMIIGSHGSGVEYTAREATKYLNLKIVSINLHFIDYEYSLTEIQNKIKSLSGDTVLLFSDIQYLKSKSIEDMIIHEMSNPDRQIIITGIKCNSTKIVSKVNEIINMTVSFKDWASSFGN